MPKDIHVKRSNASAFSASLREKNLKKTSTSYKIICTKKTTPEDINVTQSSTSASLRENTFKSNLNKK